MPSKDRIRTNSTVRRTDVICFAVGVLLTSLIVVWVYQLTEFSIKVPINFSGDSVLTMSAIQNMINGGWYFQTDRLGYPFGQALQDFPAVADGCFLLVLRFFSFFTSNPAIVFNSVFLMALPLNYTGCFLGLRMLRIRASFSLVLGLLFAVVPYNFLHGPPHVGLVWNFSIPVWLAFVIRQSSSEPLVSLRDTNGLFRRLNFRPVAIAVVVGLVAGSTGFYYFVFFLLLAVPMAAREISRSKGSFAPWIAISVLSSLFVVAIQILPVLLFQVRFGSNSVATTRLIGEVVLYGLRPASLFVSPHYSQLGAITSWLDGFEPSVENATSIGLTLGSILFLAVVGMFFTAWSRQLEIRAAVFFVILAVPYGGGYILGLLGFTQLRVWSRTSIVLACLAVFIFARWLELTWSSARVRKAFVFAILTAGVAVQLLDSVPRYPSQADLGVLEDWRDLRTFTRTIRDRFGHDLSIFQLPIVPFPEHPPVGGMTDYDHLKPYVLSPHFRLSYGGVKGRTIPWQDRLGADPETQIRGIQLAGFDAVWIDRRAWLEEGNPYEVPLSRLVEGRSVVSPSGRYVLYVFSSPIIPMNQDEDARRRAILSPVLPIFGRGFFPTESDNTRSWTWSGKQGTVNLINLARIEKAVEIRMTIELRDKGSLALPDECLSTNLANEMLFLVKCVSTVPAKGSTLSIRSTVKQIADTDPRDLRFRVLEMVTYAIDP